MTKSPLYVYILLDRSGSMEDCRDTTIDSFNEYVMGLRRSDTVDARLTLTIFDSEGIDVLQHDTPARDFMELSRRNYEPRSMTPLLDAIGHAVAEVDKVTLRPDEKVSLVIITDGQENASKEYKLADIKALLDGRQKDKGWMVTFLGAEVDTFADAGRIGIEHKDRYYIKKKKMLAAFYATRAAQERYASSGNMEDTAFTAEEREDLARD